MNEAEYQYFILKNIQNENSRAELQRIHENILKGKYDAAEMQMKNFKYLDNESKNNLLLYACSMDYIKSNYESSIAKSNTILASYASNKKSDFYVRALHAKARSISALGQNDVARALIKEAIELFRQNKNEYIHSLSYYYYGVFISESGKHEEAIDYLEKSKKISERINDLVSIAATQSFIGLSLSHLGKYSEAIDIINQSIEIRSNLGDKRGLANSYLNMNKVYTELGDTDKRLTYEKKSLNICEEIGDKQCISGRLTNIGDILFLEGDFENALRYQVKAKKIAEEIGIKYRIAEIHYHLAEIFNAKKQFDKALAHTDTCMQLRIGTEDFEGIGMNSILKAQVLVNLKKTELAKIEAERAYKIAVENKLIHVKRDAHRILGLIYEKDKNAQKALFHIKNFHLIKDSLFNIEKSKVILRKEIEKKYQVEELNNKKIQAEKEFELEKQREKTSNLIWIGVVVIISLLVIAYLFYLKYASQKSLNVIVKKNKTLSDQLAILEKQSIFSQTIASISHELNTPLGVIKAATNEYQILLSDTQSKERHNLNINEIKFLESFKDPNSREFQLNSSTSAREKRNKSNSIQVLLAAGNFEESAENIRQLSIKITQLNLTVKKEKDLIDGLISNELTSNFIDYLFDCHKKSLLDNSIDQAITASNNVVKELNDLAENQLKTGTLEPVLVYEELTRLVKIHKENEVLNVSVELTIHPSMSLFFDRQQFIQISNLLLNNMFEVFENKKKQGCIWVTSWEDSDWVSLNFSNNGEPIPASELPKLFDRFYTTKNKKIHRGLGLSIVKHTLESYNGTILVASDETRTTFELKFRKAWT